MFDWMQKVWEELLHQYFCICGHGAWKTVMWLGIRDDSSIIIFVKMMQKEWRTILIFVPHSWWYCWVAQIDKACFRFSPSQKAVSIAQLNFDHKVFQNEGNLTQKSLFWTLLRFRWFQQWDNRNHACVSPFSWSLWRFIRYPKYYDCHLIE